MSYVSCPRCGLTVRLRAAFLALDHCPRCLARPGIAVEMLTSERRIWPRPTGSAQAGAAQPPIHQVAGSARGHDDVGQPSVLAPDGREAGC
jgi:hypothetical protein